MRYRCSVVIAVLALIGVCLVARAESASVELEKGIYTEETVGDLDAAIEIYQQVLRDAEANRATLARAHYRLASCFLKKGQRPHALEELEKLITRYPGQTALVRQARAMLDSLVLVDPASLMPPETLLYYEIGSPGQQVETILKMLKDTPFANPLAAIGGGAAAGGRSPEDIMAALLNPSMIEEFKKVRGLAVGIHGFEIQEHRQSAQAVAVFYPGESDALRGIISAAVGMAGPPGEPIEGMETILFGGPGAGGCAYDDKAIIVANPLEQLKWSVRQYKGISHESTLASANEAFAGLGRDARQRDALTIWLNSARIFAIVEELLAQSPAAERMHVIDGFADFTNISGVLLRHVIDEKEPFIELSADLKEGHQSAVYDLVRTPNLSKAGFEAVPPEAIALASAALSEADAGAATQVDAAQKALRQLTGLDVGRELFANIEQVTVFLLPPSQDAPTSVLSAVSPLLPRLGLAITSHNPQQTRELLDRLLRVPGLMTGRAGTEPARQASAGAIAQYRVAIADGQPIDCYMAQGGRSTIIALSPQIVRASLDAVESGQSALAAGSLHGPLDQLTPVTSKLVLANVGGAIQAMNAQMRGQGELLEQQWELLSQLAEAFGEASIQLRTEETARRLNVRLSAHELPPLGGVLPLLMQVAQVPVRIGGAPRAEPANVSYHAQAIGVDGDLSDWEGVEAIAWSHGSADAGTFQLCWREDGLYGAVRSSDDSLAPNHAEPWTDDSVQLFIERDYARSTQHTEQSMGILLWPAPETGPGDAHISFDFYATEHSARGAGREEESGISCAWAPTPNGYALEFLIPAQWLEPAKMQPGTHLGLALFLRNGSISQVASFCSGDRDDTWQRPDTWGAVQLVREEPEHREGSEDVQQALEN